MSLSMISCGKAPSAFFEDEVGIEKSADSTAYKAKWSIYIYMVGSDLEDADLNELSKLTTTMTEQEAQAEKEGYDNMVAERIRNFTQEVSDMGLTLPNVLYNKAKDEEEEEKNTDPDATGYGTYNIEMLLGSDIPEGVQFIIQTGGARRWQTSLVNPNRSQRFIIDSYGMELLTDEPVKNMADPDTLEEFLVFCKEYFPAEHEMVLFWDHGGGYSGFGMDEIFGTDMLTVREMCSALANVQALYSPYEPLFEFIAFDACLMGNLETARLFRNYARYYLSSAEVLSGVGWGYDRIVQALADDPDMTAEELGIAISKANVANVQIEDYEGVYPAIYSMLDLEKIEPVYEAYSRFAKKALRESIEDVSVLSRLSSAASRTLSYAVGNCGGYNLIDLTLFADNFAGLFPQEAKEIKDAVADCMLYVEATTYYGGAGGLSVFFPARMTGVMSLRKYLAYTYDVSDNPDIDALYYYKITGGLNEKLLNYVYSQGYGEPEYIDYYYMGDIPYLDYELSGDGNLSACLPDYISTLLQSAQFGLVYLDEEYGDLAYFGEIQELDIAADGTVSTDFTLSMPSLGENELPVELINETAEHIDYRVPILYYDMDCYMVIRLDKESREYTIMGFTVGADNGTGMAERTVIEFDEGDVFYVAYKYGNLYSNVESEAYGEYEYSKDMKVVDKVLSDGCYFEYICFTDLRSDLYYSPMIFFVVEDGVVTEQYIDASVNAIDMGTKD